MIYSVRHRTTFTYESPVNFARCVLRLTPQSSASQTVLHSQMTVTPAPTGSLERTGPFGAQTTTVVIETAHTVLVIETQARIDVHSRANSLDFGEAWESVRARALESRALDAEAPAHLLYPSPRAPLTRQITDYARVSFGPGRGVVQGRMGTKRRETRTSHP